MQLHGLHCRQLWGGNGHSVHRKYKGMVLSSCLLCWRIHILQKLARKLHGLGGVSASKQISKPPSFISCE
ncbi:hypothetical protein Ancab_040549 [Ancistrocladus abbreviatus]